MRRIVVSGSVRSIHGLSVCTSTEIRTTTQRHFTTRYVALEVA